MEETHKIVSEPLKNKLNTKWVVWYHNPIDKSWSRESYKHILELEHIEDLLILNKSWETYLPKLTNAMYFVMRQINGKNIYHRRCGLCGIKIGTQIAISWLSCNSF